ncbi:MAG: hypothetical protein IK069_00285 [Firmicutes bacterium]|nr:hypothetical protein [Bacillota bacterium]
MIKLSKEDKKIRAKKTEHRIVAFLLSLCCVILLVFVGLDAQSSKLQYEINSINNQISESQHRIRNLEVKIKSASNIRTIEKKALAMGMKYPGFEQLVHLNAENEINEFALALIESAYQ